uniref:hypothetical protein n=1 Tax=Methylobacterium sp. B34 TaxID=95563 RepID=UPI000345C9C6|nr:hypothetical protein [Methylobacterium sp. B34]
MGENHRYASIPEVVADRWTAEGFDFKRAKPAEVMARLRKEGLDCLITTNRVL